LRRTNIYLDDEQLRALKHLAAEERDSVAVLVRRAVNEYLERHFGDNADWAKRFDALVNRVQQRLPAGLTADQIEADITAAREEVGAARRAARSGRGARGR